MQRPLIFVLAGLLVSACGILGPDEKLVIGAIDIFNLDDIDPLVVPDSVAVGKEFLVTVTTTGGGCYRAGNRTDVEIQGNVATITPYDYRYIGGDACILPLYYFTHETTLRFTEAGEAKVILRGRGDNGSIVTIGDSALDAIP